MKADIVAGERLSSVKIVSWSVSIRAFSSLRVSIIERITRANGTGPVRLPRLYVCVGFEGIVSMVEFPRIAIDVVFVTFAEGKKLLSWHSRMQKGNQAKYKFVSHERYSHSPAAQAGQPPQMMSHS